MFADAHTHLDFPDFAPDLDGVIQNARDAGVALMVTTGTSAAGSLRAVGIAENHDGVVAAVGIHPHDAGAALEEDFGAIADLCGRPKTVAVGEIGLDFHYDHSPRDRQREVFRRLLGLAKEKALPVVIHSREAEEEAFKTLLEEGIERAFFHCYTGSVELANKITGQGYYIGVSGIATFKNPGNANLIAALPPDRLLTETDAPFLSPVPFRGKRNEPCRIPVIFDKLCALFPGRTRMELEAILWNNAEQFFRRIS